MSDYQVVDLASLNKGAVADLFEREWQKVLDNIQDINTDPKALRKVTIEIKVRPSEDRNKADTTIQVKSALAGVRPHEHFIVFAPRGGKVTAFTTDPKEQGLPFDDGGVMQFKGGS